MKSRRLNIVPALLAALLAWAMPVSGCRQSPYPVDRESHNREIAEWKTTRLERLKSETGWLTLCGLVWLKEGENTIGSDSSNAVVFPAGTSPARAGSLVLERGVVRLTVLPGVKMLLNDSAVSSVAMQSDERPDVGPTVITIGRFTFQVIKRVDQFGVRIKNKDNPARLKFSGLEYFPVDLKWRVVAKFEPYVPPKILRIPTMINTVEDNSCPGALAFEIDGKSYRIDAVIEAGAEDRLFLMFGDATNGKETYGVGRQLYTSLPDSNAAVVIDFNRAYNWPCVFTVYATCPIPPRQNVLPIRVEAGEKMYAGHPDA